MVQALLDNDCQEESYQGRLERWTERFMEVDAWYLTETLATILALALTTSLSPLAFHRKAHFDSTGSHPSGRRHTLTSCSP